MIRFTPTERRTLSLALALLALGTAARLLLAPGRAEFEWRPSGVSRASESLSTARSLVEDTLSSTREASRPLASGEKIDPNVADAVQLQRLPAVGPARAGAIVRDREANGPFQSPADLARVPGVGPGLIERWSGVLVTSGGTARLRRNRDARIDLNRALPNELEQITGIGPALARRIVEARARRGRFSSVEELLEVPGIGPKTLDILHEQAFVR